MSKELFGILALALSLPISIPVSAQEEIVARRPELEAIEGEPGLPRVLVIGDSISIGYTLGVRALLRGKANVHRPAENCRHTDIGLEKLEEWLGDQPWDVIHFNWGLHDLKYVDENWVKMLPGAGGKLVNSPQAYSANLEALVRQLKSSGASLIFATTTPTPEGADGRIAGDSAKYNKVAKKVMKKHGVPVNDLYELVRPKLVEVQKERDVHFVSEGYEVMAMQVAARIESALKSSPH